VIGCNVGGSFTNVARSFWPLRILVMGVHMMGATCACTAQSSGRGFGHWFSFFFLVRCEHARCWRCVLVVCVLHPCIR
jgi:hypothetical protein